MKKTLVTAISLALLGTVWSASAFASSKLVTPDVPLTSRYYSYIDKLEAMGFITDMSSSTKPYSRLEVAKMLAKVNPQGMQPYLKVWYDEMCDEFSDEIAYIIVHRPVVQEVTLKKNSKAKTKVVKLNRKSKNKANNTEFVTNTMSTNDGQTVNGQLVANGDQVLDREEAAKAAKHHQEYYADKHNWLVAEKVKLASPKHFPSNVKLRNASVEMSYQKMDQFDYMYGKPADKHSINASYQPLHGDNAGYRYGRGTNFVGELNISGSLSNDVALSLTPRFSWDKDQKGDASLRDGYLRTHLGVWSLTVGKQAINWASQFDNAGISISNNATPQNMVRLGFIEPQETKEWGWFKWLGKIDVHAFYAIQEGDREKQFKNWKQDGRNWETDHLKFIGARMEIQPVDTLTIGFERLSHVKKFGKNWFLIRDDGIDDWNAGDYGNDQNGIDWRLKFPGVQFYGGWHGEDGDKEITDLFTTARSRRYGIYFPQLVKDGSWDLKVEHTFNGELPYLSWYWHNKPDGNGWTYQHDIMGDAMGTNADKYRAIINNYQSNGDILSFKFENTRWDRSKVDHPVYKEFSVSYAHKLKENVHLDAMLGYAKIKNADYKKGKNDSSKFVALGLNWQL